MLNNVCLILSEVSCTYYFHLIHSMHLMLWQDEPDVPFTDEDYRRRRPHPNFKDAITLEKNVIKYGKTVGIRS